MDTFGDSSAGSTPPSVAAGSRDPLTGLATRSTWDDRLDHALERCRRSRHSFGVLLVDVDDFKQVNDSLGHDTGDAFLAELGRRMSDAVRAQDTVARLGGDEFGILVEDLDRPESAVRVARKLLDHLTVPMELTRAVLPVSVSIGVAIVSPDGRELSAAFATKAADTALYDAKHRGKNRFSLFTDHMDRALLASIRFDDEVERAAVEEELTLDYQPIFLADTSTLVGFEALLRWERGRRTACGPSEFVPVLERLGLMDRVGEAVIAEAVAQLARWRRSTGADVAMHVNVSPAQLLDRGFAGRVSALLDLHELPPDALVIEVTEQSLVRHADAFGGELARLRARGLRVAIDDFGVGDTSLLHLRDFRADLVKLDRSFVHALDSNPVDRAIVTALIGIARDLDLPMIAEGVETTAQLDDLAGLGAADGVTMVQGYLTGAPMPADRLERSFTPFTALMPTTDRAGLGDTPGIRPGRSRLRTATLATDPGRLFVV